MILKLQTAREWDHWLWLDNLAKVQTYGLLTVPPGHRLSIIRPASGQERDDAPEIAAFRTQGDLAEVVDATWGPVDIRQFAEELWPEFYLDQDPTTVTCARLERRDRSVVLLLTFLDAFLLDDGGNTIDRLR